MFRVISHHQQLYLQFSPTHPHTHTHTYSSLGRCWVADIYTTPSHYTFNPLSLFNFQASRHMCLSRAVKTLSNPTFQTLAKQNMLSYGVYKVQRQVSPTSKGFISATPYRPTNPPHPTPHLGLLCKPEKTLRTRIPPSSQLSTPTKRHNDMTPVDAVFWNIDCPN